MRDDRGSRFTFYAGIAEALQAKDEARAETLIQQHVSGFQQEIKAVL